MKPEVRTTKKDSVGVYVRLDRCKVRPVLDRELFGYDEEKYGDGGVGSGQVVEVRPTDSEEWCEVTLPSGRSMLWMKYFGKNPF